MHKQGISSDQLQLLQAQPNIRLPKSIYTLLQHNTMVLDVIFFFLDVSIL